MSTELDPDGPVPLYKQLADLLRRQIDAGEIPPGRAVPSKKRLRQEFGVAAQTVDRAMQILKDEGRIEFVSGKGLFVVER